VREVQKRERQRAKERERDQASKSVCESGERVRERGWEGEREERESQIERGERKRER
jgi:hypothetical protein